MDASNDGEVDRSEFVSFAMKAESGLNEEEADQNPRQEVTATPASPMKSNHQSTMPKRPRDNNIQKYQDACDEPYRAS